MQAIFEVRKKDDIDWFCGSADCLPLPAVLTIPGGMHLLRGLDTPKDRNKKTENLSCRVKLTFLRHMAHFSFYTFISCTIPRILETANYHLLEMQMCNQQSNRSNSCCQ